MNRPPTTFVVAAALVSSLAVAAEEDGGGGSAVPHCSLGAKCKGGSSCESGSADYGAISMFPYESPIPFLEETSRHGEHCAGCPVGHTGVTCKHKYEVCDEASGFTCFHGSRCVQISSPREKRWEEEEEAEEMRWGCDCVGGAKHYAGTHCEHHWTDVCRRRHREADGRDQSLEEDEPWFCTNGGSCLEDEDDLLRKCQCLDPWTGPRCEFLKGTKAADEYKTILEENCVLDCKNGGKCMFDTQSRNSNDVNGTVDSLYTTSTKRHAKDDMHCVCLEGYAGLACETAVTPVVRTTSAADSKKELLIGMIVVLCAAVLFCLVAFVTNVRRKAKDRGAVHADKLPRKGDSSETLDTVRENRTESPACKGNMEVVVI